ncbi:MAG: NTP transferase domain-containing protein [Dehalococcoidia bacterium]
MLIETLPDMSGESLPALILPQGKDEGSKGKRARHFLCLNVKQKVAPIQPHLSAILLAAGLSTRMAHNKALLPWLGSTLLEYQLRQLSQSRVQDIVLVLGHEAEKLRPLATGFPGVKTVTNAAYKEGRAGSVVVGASALSPQTSAVLVLGVDQPRPTEVLDLVIQAHLDGPGLITIPTYEGRRGHPVVFDGSLIGEIKDVSEANQGLRQVVRRDPERVHELSVSYPVVLLDINTPEDYQREASAKL